MAAAYYNEFDRGAAAWLRELIRRGLIADGEVDERSILDVSADDLNGFTQCHFFAGIGGWSYALRLSGWPDDQPVWTGSPPCQPFSTAGKQKGKDDERHLAPHFASLVASGRPPILFGEQVASAAVFGKAAKGARKEADGEPQWAWIDDLQDRLEAAHYAVGASDIPAASVGAPHIRQRTFFGAVRLADAIGFECKRESDIGPAGIFRKDVSPTASRDGLGNSCAVFSGLADADGVRHKGQREVSGSICAAENQDREERGVIHDCGGGVSGPASPLDGFWRGADWLFCRDGKWRPVEPGTSPLADGLPRGMGSSGNDSEPFHPQEARVMRLRGYGNAIVPQVAAEFIRAFTQSPCDTATT